MGGFGAIHTGLAYPNTFSKIMGLSNALIIYDIKGMKEGTDNGIADYNYYKMVFGDLETVDKSRKNPEQLVLASLEKGERIPPMYLAIGTEDFLYEQNQIFRRFLTEHNVEFKYTEEPGNHNFDFWNPHLVKALDWFLEE